MPDKAMPQRIRTLDVAVAVATSLALLPQNEWTVLAQRPMVWVRKSWTSQLCRQRYSQLPDHISRRARLPHNSAEYQFSAHRQHTPAVLHALQQPALVTRSCQQVRPLHKAVHKIQSLCLATLPDVLVSHRCPCRGHPCYGHRHPESRVREFCCHLCRPKLPLVGL